MYQLLLVFCLLAAAGSISPDPNGYIVYCPCMGRFGNQAEQFLGALAFSKALDRTLILPPWVEYRDHHRSVVMVPFDDYFSVESLSDYHRVITMETFMKELAGTVWPPGERKVFCYQARTSTSSSGNPGCNAKDGSPFGPFWDWFKIDFDESEIYSPLYYDTESSYMVSDWQEKYPSSKFPVLAFVGPPGSFPVSEWNARLQKFVRWSTDIDAKAKQFIEKEFGSKPFLAIHLRNGPDFERACEHVSQTPKMFAAAQCIGHRGEQGPTTHEMCFPTTETVLKQVKKEVDRLGLKAVFIGADFNNLKKELAETLGKDVKLAVAKRVDGSHILDLAIMTDAEHFIGNCVSTFTAFAKRYRDVLGQPSSFWAFEMKKKHVEL